jgi:hypothetical protein
VENGRTVLIGVAIVYAALVVAFPWLLLLPLVLANPKVRAALRAPITAWLDRYAADSSTG